MTSKKKWILNNSNDICKWYWVIPTPNNPDHGGQCKWIPPFYSKPKDNGWW